MSVDHDKAHRIATEKVSANHPAQESVRLVFDAYLDAMRRLREIHDDGVTITKFGFVCDFCGGGGKDLLHATYCPMFELQNSPRTPPPAAPLVMPHASTHTE